MFYDFFLHVYVKNGCTGQAENTFFCCVFQYSDSLVPLVVSVQVVMTAKMLSRDHSDFWCLM